MKPRSGPTARYQSRLEETIADDSTGALPRFAIPFRRIFRVSGLDDCPQPKTDQRASRARRPRTIVARHGRSGPASPARPLACRALPRPARWATLVTSNIGRERPPLTYDWRRSLWASASLRCLGQQPRRRVGRRSTLCESIQQGQRPSSADRRRRGLRGQKSPEHGQSTEGRLRQHQLRQRLRLQCLPE